MLGQLIDRLSFLKAIDPTDPSSKTDSKLWKAYKERETDICVLPLGKDKPSSIATMQAVRQKAVAYLAQLKSGQDVFGHSNSWVPRGSFNFYDQQTNKMLDKLHGIEKNYHMYQKKHWEQKKRLQWVQDAVAAANEAITKMTLQQDTTAELLRPLANDIRTLTTQVPVKKKKLMAAIKAVEDKIRDMKDFSLKSFLDSAVTFAFVSTPIMGVTMAALIGGAVWRDSSKAVTDSAGNMVEKEYLIDSLHGMNGTIAELKDAARLTSTGAIETDDAGGAKLIATKQALMGLIGQYRRIISNWQNIEALFDDYTNVAVTRNNKVIEYNQYVISWLQDELALWQLRDQLGRLRAKELDEIDPDLPVVAVMVAHAYHASVERIMRVLYMAERALAFWAVDLPLDNMNTVRHSGMEADGLTESLRLIKINIMAAYVNAVESSTLAYQRFGSWGGPGQPNVPLCYQLKDYEWEPLRDGKTSVVMASMYAGMTLEDNPFLGLCDVRLTNVRFILEGELRFVAQDVDVDADTATDATATEIETDIDVDNLVAITTTAAVEKTIRVMLKHVGMETIVGAKGFHLRPLQPRI